MILRPYQETSKKAVMDEWFKNDVQSTLMVMPTGTGKTISLAHIANEFTDGRVLLLAHREELIFQGAEKIERVTGEKPDIEMANLHADGGVFQSRFIVSSIQTQNANRADGSKRMDKFDPFDFSLVIVDESHHAVSPSYQSVLDHYKQNPNVKILGLTATPDRFDEKALGQIFDSVAYNYELPDAIEDGWLVPIKQRVLKCEHLDLSAVRTTAGDFNGKDLAKVMENEVQVEEIVMPVLEHTGDRQTLVFATTLAHANLLCQLINELKPGDHAQFVHGGTPKDERRNIIKQFKNNTFQYLVNVGVFLEGYDEPSIECVVMARPTKSRSLYAQALGRGTRPLDGLVDGISSSDVRKAAIASSSKPFLEVLDFVGNSGRHKLITAIDVLGGDYEDNVLEEALRLAKAHGGISDPTAFLEAAQHNLAKQISEDIKRKRAGYKWTSKWVDPFDVFDIEPGRERGWNDGRSPTERMTTVLTKAGIEGSGYSFQEASTLIGHLIQRSERDLCTYKQAKLLKRYGYENALNYSFKEASSKIDALAQNHWKRPADDPSPGQGSLLTIDTHNHDNDNPF